MRELRAERARGSNLLRARRIRTDQTNRNDEGRVTNCWVDGGTKPGAGATRSEIQLECIVAFFCRPLKRPREFKRT